jgi:hypothetical protein
MLVALDNVVKVESVPLNFNFFSLRACAQIVKSRESRSTRSFGCRANRCPTVNYRRSWNRLAKVS